jgi:methyl-accepting chemotaxis protein
MRWFLDLSARAKFTLSFGLLLILLLIVVGTAYGTIRAIQTSQEQLFNRDFANIADLATLEADLNRTRADTLAVLLTDKGAEQGTLLRDIQDFSREADDRLQKLLKRNAGDAAVLARLKELEEEHRAFKNVRENKVLPAIRAGKSEEAKAASLSQEQRQRYQKVRDIVRELTASTEDQAKKAVAESAQGVQRSVLVFAAISLGALLASLALAFLFNRTIAAPLTEVSAAARRIAAGNLKGESLPVASADEVGQLAQAFNQMQGALRELAERTRAITQSLAAAAAQIMASIQEQAASTRQQAATVQEITTTMEEVSQSGAQIAAKAKQVAAAAEATSTASTSGLQAVQGTTKTMIAIREQVEQVAENIVALSEKTQAISEIIATVNDIAERSNLLALNAAIEAAAAGEQGSRFSVVASEMKGLADQAKESTVQVRSILGDIQKGINSSVMLTEEAVKRVESGKHQADVAEETIRQMTQMTLESIQAFEQIIGAGNQQQIGFEQVAQGMKDIRQAAAQTAAATGQLEKAVANLNALSHDLKETVGRYQL